MAEMTDRELLEQILKNQEEMKHDLKLIHLSLENDVTPTINLLLELQLEHSKRFIKLEKAVQKLQDDYVIDEVLKDIIH